MLELYYKYGTIPWVITEALPHARGCWEGGFRVDI